MNWLSRRLSWLLMVASAALFFLPLGGRALWNSDEGRYAEIAREMLEQKDWIVPHLNYVPYFEKPPLMYWLTAGSFAVFGQTEFAARFWGATFGLLTIWVVYLLGKLWKGERAGLLAGSILATSLLFFCLTQYLVLDMALTFWMTLSLYASARILIERPPERVRRAADLLAMAMAGGVLTKGLIALVFPLAILGLTMTYTRYWSQARKASWPAALILFSVLAAPWFVLISMKHPTFPQFFFVREHFSRFLSTVHHRTAPIYFFIPVLLGGFLPWCVFLPRVFLTSFKHRGQAMKRDPVRALLVIWSLFIFVFFSLSQSKLAGYLLPVFPALALLVAAAFDEALDEEDLQPWIASGVVRLIFVYIVGLVLLKLPQAAGLFTDPAAAVIHAQAGPLSLILACGVFVFVGVWGMRENSVCLGGILLVQVIFLSSLGTLAVELDPFLSNRGMSRFLTLHARPEDRIVVYGISFENVVQSLPFYTHKRVAVFGDAGELSMGRDMIPDAGDWFVEESGAVQALAAVPVGSWVVTNDEHEKVLRQAGLAADFDPATREGYHLLLHKVR